MRNALVFFLLLVTHVGLAQRAVPPLWGHRVHDDAHVLSSSTIDELELMLKKHEDSTSNQIAVLIIPSLEGDNLEEYSLRVAHDEWKLGTSKNDNGILLLVSVNEHKMRIEVGQGLEGVVPDAISSRIIRNEMAPLFREGNYDEGVKAGVLSIIKAINNEYTIDSEEPIKELTLKEKLVIGLFLFVVLGTFTFLGLIIPGCAGWGLYAFLIPFYAVFPLVILDVNGGLGVLGSYLIGFPILKTLIKRTEWGKKVSERMKTRNSPGGTGSGWFSRWSSGSSWSSGGGGGGFSGGGGSFGGGGSSGSW
jgi:uncharacterized protein